MALLDRLRELPFKEFEFHGFVGTGAAIGWHRDKAVFGDVIGISLLSSGLFRLRRKAGTKWERASLRVDPRSAYLLR